ncbi:MAG: hypothetical protein H5U04_03115 [Firmicutes bacterium]|nr:hypothetical protein [Bacillota bacterium]
MSAFWPLFRLTLNNTLGLSAARYVYLVQRKRLWEPVLIALGVGVGGGAFVFFLYQVARAFVAVGLMANRPEIVFTFAFLVASTLVLVFGFAAVISIFYFSTDLGLLVPLPLRPGTIVLAKFAVIVVGEYVGILLAMGPAATAYAQLVGGSLSYWLAVLLVVLLAPVIPLAIAAVVTLAVMRFINRRHRDILIILFSVALTAGILAFQIGVMNNLPSQGDPALYLQQILSGHVDLVAVMGRAFPPAVWATRVIAGATAGSRLVGLALYVGVTGVAVWVLATAGDRLFYAGLIGGTELARRRLTAHQLAAARAAARHSTVQSGVLSALFWREWRLFMRVPLYVLNGFSASLIVPIIFVFGFRGIMSDPDMIRLLDAIYATGNAAFFTSLAVAGLTVLVTALNTTAASAVSREGRYLWISKVIPVPPEKLVQGKMLFAAVAAAVSALPMLVLFAFALRMRAVHLAEVLVLTGLGSAVSVFVGLLVDLARPFLTWTNPQQAVKSNLNVIIPLPVIAGLEAGLGYLALWLTRTLEWEEGTVVVTLAGLLAVLAVLLYRLTVSAGKRLYERLEP